MEDIQFSREGAFDKLPCLLEEWRSANEVHENSSAAPRHLQQSIDSLDDVSIIPCHSLASSSASCSFWPDEEAQEQDQEEDSQVDEDDDENGDDIDLHELQFNYFRDTFYFAASLTYLIHSIWEWRWEELNRIGMDLSEDDGREVPILSLFFPYDNLNAIGATLTILGVLVEVACTLDEVARYGKCVATRRYMRGLSVYLFGSAFDLVLCLIKDPDDWSYGFLFADYCILLGSIVCVVLANTNFSWSPRKILTKNEDMIDLLGTTGEIFLSYADCEFFWAHKPVTYTRWTLVANVLWVLESLRQLGMDVLHTIRLTSPLDWGNEGEDDDCEAIMEEADGKEGKSWRPE